MALIDQYRALHSQGKFLGLSVVKFADEIETLCKQHACKDMLDYGAGQGYQYSPPHSLDRKWGVDVTCYDPAVSGMEALPDRKFDIVICADVLEHVPEEEIAALLESVFRRAAKVAFFTVCCRPAKKTLPNGQNTHCTIRPMIWWNAEIAAAAACPFVLRETP